MSFFHFIVHLVFLSFPLLSKFLVLVLVLISNRSCLCNVHCFFSNGRNYMYCAKAVVCRRLLTMDCPKHLLGHCRMGLFMRTNPVLLRLDSQCLISLAFMHSVPLFYVCPPFMNMAYKERFHMTDHNHNLKKCI